MTEPLSESNCKNSRSKNDIHISKIPHPRNGCFNKYVAQCTTANGCYKRNYQNPEWIQPFVERR